jgi:carboxyl-terminal processing protease
MATSDEILGRYRAALGPARTYRASCEVTGTSVARQSWTFDETTPRLRFSREDPAMRSVRLLGFDGSMAWEAGSVYDCYFKEIEPELLGWLLLFLPLDHAGVPGRIELRPVRHAGFVAEGELLEREVLVAPGRWVPQRFVVDPDSGRLLEARGIVDVEERTRFGDWRPVGGTVWPFEWVHTDRWGTSRWTFTQFELAEPPPEELRHPRRQPPATHARDSNPDRASLEIVHETIAEAFYDPGLTGVDWAEIWRRYQPQGATLAGEGGRDFVELANRMLAELGVSHTYVSRPPQPVARKTGQGALGLQLCCVGTDEICVEECPAGAPAAASPLRPGDAIRSIGGRTPAELLAQHAERLRRWMHRPEQALLRACRTALAVDAGERIGLQYEDRAGVRHELSLEAIVDEDRRDDPRLSFSREGELLAIRFRGFEGDLVERLEEVLAQNRDARGALLDLRSNPGGLSQLSARVGGLFTRQPLPLGTLVFRSSERLIETVPAAEPFDGLLAILIDELTASAAEAVTVGLQEGGRATVLGRPSAGAFLLSREKRLPNGCALSWGVANARSPGGIWLEGVGVQPDIAGVERTREDLYEGRDPLLQQALGWLRGALPA